MDQRLRFVIRDRDAEFGPEFDTVWKADGGEVITLEARSDTANFLPFLVRGQALDPVLPAGKRDLNIGRSMRCLGTRLGATKVKMRRTSQG